MYSQSISHSDGYNKMVKQSVQHHVPSASNRHSHVKDTRKSDSMQRQKSADKTSLQKSSSHSSKSSSEHNKPHKVQGALRSCGNWTEHRSSSGKIYFYNTLSEVSQWEKPKEWNDGIAVDLRAKDKLKPPVQRSTSKTTSRHLSSSKPTTETDKDYRQQQKDYCDRDYRNKPSSSEQHDYKDIDYRSGSSKNSQNRNNIRRSVSTDRDYRSQHSSNSLNAVNNHSNTSSGGNAQENYLPSTGKFYDYSSWSTKTSSSDTKTINGITVAKPNEAFHKTEGSDNSNSSDSKNSKLSAPSEFVRKLKTVLNQAATASNPIKSEDNIKDVFQLLLDVAAKSNAENAQSDATVKTEPSEQFPVESTDEPPTKLPRSSDGSSKHPSESEASLEPEDRPFKCLNELRPLFDHTTITHVQNWPSEQNERQCIRLSEDFHRFIADNLSELSVQLTTARSQVRTSEILSTLHEQRVLYIRQQIKDLEKTSTSAGPFT